MKKKTPRYLKPSRQVDGGDLRCFNKMEGSSGEGNFRGGIGGESGNRYLLGDNHRNFIATNCNSWAASPATPAIIAGMRLCALAYKKHRKNKNNQNDDEE
jgi:hypothetical protein